jgi:hypothetical protein
MNVRLQFCEVNKFTNYSKIEKLFKINMMWKGGGGGGWLFGNIYNGREKTKKYISICINIKVP